MQLICEILSVAQLKKYCDMPEVYGFLVGVSPYSLDASRLYTKAEIKEISGICHQFHKKLLLNVARLFHEIDLKNIGFWLKEFHPTEIDYLVYSDVGLYQMLQHSVWKDALVYDAPTYLVNSLDIELYASLNHRVVVSNQITKAELMQICQTTTHPVWVDAFGKSACFYSKRKLLTHYATYRNMSLIQANPFHLQEEFRREDYPLIEDFSGTHIYESSYHVLQGELPANVECCFIKSLLLAEATYDAVITTYLAWLHQAIPFERILPTLLSLGLVLTEGAYGNKSILRKDDTDE